MNQLSFRFLFQFAVILNLRDFALSEHLGFFLSVF